MTIRKLTVSAFLFLGCLVGAQPVVQRPQADIALDLSVEINRANILYAIPSQLFVIAAPQIINRDPYLAQMTHILRIDSAIRAAQTTSYATQVLARELLTARSIRDAYGVGPELFTQLAIIRAVFTNTFAVVTFYQHLLARIYTMPACILKQPGFAPTPFVKQVIPADVLATLKRIEILKVQLAERISESLFVAGKIQLQGRVQEVIIAKQIVFGRASFPNPLRIDGAFCPRSFYQQNNWLNFNYANNVGEFPHLPYYPVVQDVQKNPALVPYVDNGLAPRGYEVPEMYNPILQPQGPAQPFVQPQQPFQPGVQPGVQPQPFQPGIQPGVQPGQQQPLPLPPGPGGNRPRIGQPQQPVETPDPWKFG